MTKKVMSIRKPNFALVDSPGINDPSKGMSNAEIARDISVAVNQNCRIETEGLTAII